MEFKRETYKKEIGEREGLTIFPSAHDVFPFNKAVSFRFLKKLIHPKTHIYNKVMFITKPRMSVIRPFVDRFKKYKEHILLRFTITTSNEDLVAFWEGNSSSPEERKECLIYCYEKGFDTSISTEPYLDTPENLVSLITSLNDYVSDTLWIGHMNRISTEKWLKKNGYSKKEILYYKQIRKNCKEDKLISIVNELANIKKIRYKESFLKKKEVLSSIPEYQLPKLPSS